jgi:hypothetical protein
VTPLGAGIRLGLGEVEGVTSIPAPRPQMDGHLGRPGPHLQASAGFQGGQRPFQEKLASPIEAQVLEVESRRR